MALSERLKPPTSIPLKVKTAGNWPLRGTCLSCGKPDCGLIHENGLSAGSGVVGKGNPCLPSDMPVRVPSASTCTPPSDYQPLGQECNPVPISPSQNHSLPARLNLSRQDTVGYTHCDGQGQVWCDGRNRTRMPMDSLRPLSPGSSAVAMKTLLSNVSRLEDFEKEEIGSGFFSDVYKVRNKQTGKVLVLKMNNSESSIASVIQEIQLLKKLQHPNIIKLLGVCVHEANIHALIEYINGGDLSSVLLDDKIHLSWLVRMGLAKDIASGMSYLHMHAVIHRDLTSMNCLVKKNSNGSMHALVADLGLAARIPRDQSEKLETVGTPFWVSPENLKGQFYTEKTDLFSFGIILCEIIARITANPDELPRLHNFGLDVEAFRMLSGNCPEQLLLVAFSCCDMEPSKRLAFTEVVLSIRNIETDFAKQTKRPPSLSGRLRSQSTVISNYNPQPDSKPQLMRSPRNLVIRSNSDSGSRPRRLPSVSKKWVNPFDTPHLKNGRTKLTAQTSVALFELPTEILESLQAMCMEDEDDEEEAAKEAEDRFMRKRSKSLPTSPVIHRRELKLKLDENTDYFDSDRDFSDAMSVADRRKTLSPGFVPPTWLDGRRSNRARSKTVTELTNCDSGLGLLCEEKLGLPDGVIHRNTQIIYTVEDA